MSEKRILKERLSQMSDDELNALPPDQVDSIFQTLDADETTPVEAAVRGAGQGIYGLGDEIEALGRTAVDLMDEGSIDDLSDTYNKNLDYAREMNKVASAEHPMTSLASEVATGMAVPGMGVAKGLAGGARVAKTLVNAAVTSAATSVGKSEDKASFKTFENAFFDATTGMAFSAAMQGVVGAGSALVNQAPPAARHVVKRIFGLAGNSKQRTVMTKHLKRTGQTDGDFLKDLDQVNVNGSKLIETGDDFAEISRKTNQALNEADSEKLRILRENDYVLPDTYNKSLTSKLITELEINENNAKTASTKTLYSKMRTELQDTLLENQPIRKKQVITNPDGTTYVGEIDMDNWVPNKSIKNMSDLYLAKQQWARKVGSWDANTSAEEKGILKEIVGKVTDDIDANILVREQEGLLEKGAANAFKDSRKRVSNLILFNRAAEEVADVQKNGTFSLARDLFAGSLIAAGASAIPGVDTSEAVVIAAGMRQFTKIPQVQVGLARGFIKLADAIESRGDTGMDIARRLQQSALISTADFRRTMAAEYYKLELEDQPVERDTVDVVNKKNAILAIAERENPEFASQLRTAIDTGDDAFVEQAMNKLSKMPSAKPYFKEGIGWNGKLIDEEDVSRARQYVNNVDISLKQKLEHEHQIRTTRKAPVLRQEPDFNKFLKAYNEKNKVKKPGY